nr:MAG: putative capsid protein [Arizlama virus]
MAPVSNKRKIAYPTPPRKKLMSTWASHNPLLESSHSQLAPIGALTGQDKYSRFTHTKKKLRVPKFIKQYNKAQYWMEDTNIKTMLESHHVTPGSNSKSWFSVALNHYSWNGTDSGVSGYQDLLNLTKNQAGTAQNGTLENPLYLHVTQSLARCFMKNIDTVPMRVKVYHYYTKRDFTPEIGELNNTYDGVADLLQKTINGEDFAKDDPSLPAERDPVTADYGAAIEYRNTIQYHPLHSPSFTQYFTITKEDHYYMAAGDFVEFTLFGRKAYLNLQEHLESRAIKGVSSGILVSVQGEPGYATSTVDSLLPTASTTNKGVFMEVNKCYKYKLWVQNKFKPNIGISNIVTDRDKVAPDGDERTNA